MTGAYRTREACALCRSGGSALSRVMSLAPTPPANEFVSTPSTEQDTIPLTLVLCQRCGHVHFADSIVKKHAAYVEQGGRFLVPLPELREIS